MERSWKWIRKSKLNDNNQRSNFINKITTREALIIAIILIFSLIILIINTWLCQRYIDEKVILQRKKPKSDEYYLKRLGIKAWKFTPESRFLSLNIVRIDDKIVRVENEEDEVESVYNGETDKIRVVDNDKNDDIIIKISFNAKSDVMIQTNYPLFNINKALNMQYPPPIEYWFYYYEITILSNPNNDQTIIAIGLATKNYSINRLPGCDTHSVGFHSDEGRTFHNEGYTGSKYAEKWGKVNDVIGCGYCPNTGQIFFTMNGKNLGIAYTSLFYNWYPTIGSNGFCSLNVNFGQKKFKYKEANGMSVAGIISQELLNKVEEIIDVDKLN
ncbi:SPRY-domain-containing protein [Rhizophagus irregularis]|uniref:SPRY-domain-containing protein n=1 Tax=Rhizophagus irregularis TaxID=588596 RepID=A0A2N0Q8C0_9GLOM|nr:SPRY-domain-containing protein [Rhizophagus irregularis]